MNGPVRKTMFGARRNNLLRPIIQLGAAGASSQLGWPFRGVIPLLDREEILR